MNPPNQAVVLWALYDPRLQAVMAITPCLLRIFLLMFGTTAMVLFLKYL